MADSFPRGQFVWHELMTSDPDAAVAFYTKAMGWTTTSYEHDPNYRIWMSGQLPLGGLMRLTEEARSMGASPHWLPYVAVPDVDATERQALAMGGKVYVAAKTIAAGRMAVLADPHGATFAVFRPAASMAAPTAPPGRGEVVWHELATTDPAAAWAFYHALFGWVKTSEMDMGPAGIYQMFGGGGPPLGGIFPKSPGMPDPHWTCYTEVASVDKLAALLPKLGGRVAMGPMEISGGARIVMCLDPQGAIFAAHTAKAVTVTAAATKAATAPAATKKTRPAATRAAAKTAKPAPKKKSKPAAKKKKPTGAGKGKKSAASKARRKPVRSAKRKKTAKPARRTAPKRKAKKKTRRR